MSLNVLILGNGGREHTLAYTLAESALVNSIVVAPGNGGTADIAKCKNFECGHAPKDFERLVKYAVDNDINLVIPGPEQPLVDGVEGHFRRAGISVFGPSQTAAQCEGSKTFAKDFMARHSIPTAAFQNFDKSQSAAAKDYVRKCYSNGVSLVVKADGLAGGKGVIMPTTEQECISTVEDVLEKQQFGAAGSSLVLEQLLTGPELSVLAFTDGYTVHALPAAQDHKRIGEGDSGPNTGGMGAYTPAPAETPEVRKECLRIIQATVDGMRKDGFPMVGMLFTGFMVDPTGVKVLEYNVRFGDPETQALLRLLSPESDLAEIMKACVDRRLDCVKFSLREGEHAVSVVLASGGYPGKYPTGVPIKINELPKDVVAYHAGTAIKDGQLVTAGGRVIAVSAFGATLRDALDKAYKGVDAIEFEGKTFRKDIAHRALNKQTEEGMTYAQAGVSIEEGNRLVDLIKPTVKATKRSGADADIGGFGGAFDLKAAGFKDPILVCGTDGVGTKIKIAHNTKIHDSVGIDLVAMSVNDLIVQGAEPLLFLDYYACSKLQVDDAAAVIKGIAEGCRQANCALIGGETAEMPNIYSDGECEFAKSLHLTPPPPDDYDLAGFAVGAVERGEILPKDNIKAGDVLVGVGSSGIHSNGYSLVHKIVAHVYGQGADYRSIKAPWSKNDKTLAEELLTPTKIYVRSTLPAIRTGLVKGMSHITGGGFTDNIPRVLPKGLGAVVDAGTWTRPAIFDWLQKSGRVASKEMARTFNNGIGMVLVVDAGDADAVVEQVRKTGEDDVHVIGQVVQGSETSVVNVGVWEKNA
ncbi:hypothetical protein E3P99_00358 [Wallemia hederae]|uniref:Phosphoribosylformylglycinamidine cyclo-ligase n=1 Tax=Wallemia hederae TaxID=1540922 RepID=A0A4T0FWA3_9BASI|nr:hypothetical protein E3P99_00358 [Wallemia hederae]